jgi:hypothetical protein
VCDDKMELERAFGELVPFVGCCHLDGSNLQLRNLASKVTHLTWTSGAHTSPKLKVGGVEVEDSEAILKSEGLVCTNQFVQRKQRETHEADVD